MSKHQYTKEEIEEAVRKSTNYSQVFRNLSILVNGGSYSWIKSLIKRYNISTEHFSKTNTELIKAGIVAMRRRIASRLGSPDISTGDRIRAQALRNYLLFNNVENACISCGLVDWMGKPLRLDIDHKNGNPVDNRLENLQFICPNCHRAKTIVHNSNAFTVFRKRPPVIKEVRHCIDCDKPVNKYSTRCRDCNYAAARQGDKFDPPKVISLLKAHSLLAASKILGISDNGLRKYCKRNNIDFKSYKMKSSVQDSNL